MVWPALACGGVVAISAATALAVVVLAWTVLISQQERRAENRPDEPLAPKVGIDTTTNGKQPKNNTAPPEKTPAVAKSDGSRDAAPGVLTMLERSHARFALLAAACGCVPPLLCAQELRLEARLGDAVRPAEQAQILRAVLRNASPSAIEVYLPEHHGLVPFPEWELRGESGQVLRPETPPFQSMWKVGLQGEVLKLAPGAEASFGAFQRQSNGNGHAHGLVRTFGR